MFVRRRPLLRAAVVGGGAYAVGKRSARRSAEQAQQESGQDARISDLEQQQQQQQRAGSQPAEAGGQSVTDQLSKLADLHKQGVLTDQEFASAKAKLLGG
ncbi:MAG: SHOCT domain-containing protein [Actinomycetota bacterium]|nr:SHOCT domain-containing protein [Actinomycetota bacterium]